MQIAAAEMYYLGLILRRILAELYGCDPVYIRSTLPCESLFGKRLLYRTLWVNGPLRRARLSMASQSAAEVVIPQPRRRLLGGTDIRT